MKIAVTSAGKSLESNVEGHWIWSKSSKNSF